MCGTKGYGFSAVLVINRVSILADFGHFGHKLGMVLCSSLDMDMFLRRSHFFIIMEKKIDKIPSQIVSGNLTFVWTREQIIMQVLNRILIWVSGHK